MKKILRLQFLLGSIALAAIATSCSKTSTTKTEQPEGVQWNVSIHEVVEFRDSLTGINTDDIYTVADTTRINEKLLGIKAEGLTLGWTMPGSDGTIWLVAYDNEPLLSEKVEVTEVYSMPSHEGNIQIAFKFPDANKWATITRYNIGQQLAVLVNGRLMNAPRVTGEITGGNCSVSIPTDMEQIKNYLPNLDLEKIKQ